MPTLLLGKKDVKTLIKMDDVIQVVEKAFRAWTEGYGSMPPKLYLILDEGDFRAMPAALPGVAGLKWVNVHTRNPARGLPTVMALLVYNDPATGYPWAIMDATEITAYRTAATSAIASKYLARKESRTLGIVGAGYQAHSHIISHAALFKFQEIRIFDVNPEAITKLIQSLPDFPLKAYALQETVKSDIVCTLTPARQPVVMKKWLLPGTHINAVGADAEGKEELEPSILDDAIVVVDDVRQAGHAGEINVPVSKGLFKVEQIYGTLGEVIIGKKKGRTDSSSITIFDSTGLAIEDIATAKLIYEEAQRAHIGLSFNLVE